MGLLELKKLLWERPFEEDEKREEIFENYNKGRQPGCIKNSQNSTVKKRRKEINPLRTWAKDMNGHVTEEDIQVADSTRKDGSVVNH